MAEYTTRDIAALLGDEHVLVHVSLVEACGTLSAGVLMSQLLYWHLHGPLQDGWFWLTVDAVKAQTGMDRREFETARKRLVENGFIEVKKQGLPCKTWYRVNIDAVVAAVVEATRSRNGCGDNRRAQTRSYGSYALGGTDRTIGIVQTVPHNIDETHIDKTHKDSYISPPSANADTPPGGGAHNCSSLQTQQPNGSTPSKARTATLTDLEAPAPIPDQPEPEEPPPAPPKRPRHKPDAFDQFWRIYPRKCGKPAAIRAWDALRPSNALIEEITMAVLYRKQTPEWRKENGRYIPHPSTFLNQRRWEDIDTFEFVVEMNEEEVRK